MSNMQVAGTGHQRGAVAVLTALCIVALVGILGFVVDLGMLYVRKTELQNAADAGALGGAKEIDGTRDGLRDARTKAKDIAALNASDFGGTAVTIPDRLLNQVVQFGPSPDGAWADAETADPGTSWFIKVDTNPLAQGTRPTWFIRVLDASLATTTANGYAVAGRTACEGIPIFTCAAAPATCAPNDPGNCGFTKGTTYRIAARRDDKIIGPGSIGWMDVVGNADMKDIICRGRHRCLTPGPYNNRTQPAFGSIAAALNTRFGDFSGAFKDEEQNCPADRNVQEFLFDTGPEEWMTTPPATQWDVKWSAVRPTDATQVTSDYPDPPATPYSGSAGDFYTAPTGDAAAFMQPNRRMLVVGLAGNCNADLKTNDTVDVKAFGRFLLQKQADKEFTDKDGVKYKWGFYGEFVELVDTGPRFPPEIKLYR